MVATCSGKETGGTDTILVRPNSSLTWGQTKRLLLFFACALSAVALYFWQLGAWLVLPFLGAELALLAGGFYACCLQARRGESIAIDGDRVWVESRGGRAVFPRAWLQVRLVPHAVDGRPSRLLVGAHGRFLQVGAFLVDGERERLARLVERAAARKGGQPAAA